jgi:hypothetical protein
VQILPLLLVPSLIWFRRGHHIQWNLGNTTNHGTDVGWSCYRGDHVSEVENLGVNFPQKKTALACRHDLGDERSPFHDKNSYFLEKDDLIRGLIIIEFIILSWVQCTLGTLPVEPIWYPKAKLTLTSISWWAVQYKMGILRLVFIFCCICSWMAFHVQIKTYFLPVSYLITPEHLHMLITIQDYDICTMPV